MKLTAEDVRKIVETCGDDGHTVISPSALNGVNPAFIRRVTHQHRSDFSSPKSTIFNTQTGEPMVECVGVHTLSALAIAVNILGLEDDIHILGRGFRARAYTHTLREWLKQQES